MIDEIGKGRTFDAGQWPWQAPLGRGIYLQIGVARIAPLLGALEEDGLSLYLPVEERWYRMGAGRSATGSSSLPSLTDISCSSTSALAVVRPDRCCKRPDLRCDFDGIDRQACGATGSNRQ